ncbi:MAG: hypothetical protein EAX96_06755 [Candidatus Lokiarchaeota archaeon]|nr:hypothetical protein [Candidatus Lokiarchaeota archaeon]
MNDEKLVKTASDRMEKELKDKIGTKVSVGFLILILLISIGLSVAIFYITTNLVVQIIVIAYLVLSFIISIVHYSDNKKLQPFNKFIRYLLPINEERVRAGPTTILRYIYMITLGVILAVIIFTTNSVFNLIPGLTPITATQYGFYSMIWETGSLTMLCIFLLIVISPVVFSTLFSGAAMIYNDKEGVRYARIVSFLPILFFLPSFAILMTKLIDIIVKIFANGGTLVSLPILQAKDIYSFLSFLISFLIFLIAWIITLKIWYEKGGKRNVFIIISIGFIQAIASLFIFYHNLIQQLIFGHANSFLWTNPIQGILIQVIWFGTLVFIPIIMKLFDRGKIKFIGILFAVAAAFAFQTWSMFTCHNNILTILMGEGKGLPEIEIFLGLGYIYYYFFIFLIPIFFLFGYFQVLFVKSIYLTFRNYGLKRNILTRKIATIIGISISVIVLMFWTLIYYFLMYQPIDYYASLSSMGAVYSGVLFILYKGIMDGIPFIKVITDFLINANYVEWTSILITVSFMLYSTFRLAHNLTSESEKIGNEQFLSKTINVFKEKSSYKSRIIFGFALVSIFVGTISIYAFLWIYLDIFINTPNSFTGVIMLTLAIMDNIKLLLAVIGFITAVVFFFKYIRK